MSPLAEMPPELLVSPGCIAPWLENPHRLVSWFEMLEFSAIGFFYCGRALRNIREDAILGSVIARANEPVFAMQQDIDQRARDKVLAHVAGLESNFRNIGLVITADTVKEFGEHIKSRVRYSFQWLHDQAESIERLAEKELKGRLFLFIPPERAKFWPKLEVRSAFGDAVADSFPSSTFDANNAGICLATSQCTASVFHAMRVLEIGLAALGKVFGVSLAHTNWAPAIDQIERNIRDMHKDPALKVLPDCKEQQEFYAQAASHFGILKDAWRNHAMHVRGKYTEQEAERILESVKAFMHKLAARLHE